MSVIVNGESASPSIFKSNKFEDCVVQSSIDYTLTTQN